MSKQAATLRDKSVDELHTRQRELTEQLFKLRFPRATGRVEKMQKPVVVAVENLVQHGMYQKYIKRTSKFLAHSEQAGINVGDRVLIEETRPLSKRKRWNVREVLEKAS